MVRNAGAFASASVRADVLGKPELTAIFTAGVAPEASCCTGWKQAYRWTVPASSASV